MNIQRLTSGLLVIFTTLTSISIPSYLYTGTPAALLLAAIASSALGISARFHLQRRSSLPSQKNIKKMMKPYMDLIVETQTEPTQIQTTVEVNTLEDLAKISDIIARPILHSIQDGKHRFYIIENFVKYKYQPDVLSNQGQNVEIIQ